MEYSNAGKQTCLKTHSNKLLFCWEIQRWQESFIWEHIQRWCSPCDYIETISGAWFEYCNALPPKIAIALIQILLCSNATAFHRLYRPSHKSGNYMYPIQIPSPENYMNPAVMIGSRSHPSWTEIHLNTPKTTDLYSFCRSRWPGGLFFFPPSYQI